MMTGQKDGNRDAAGSRKETTRGREDSDRKHLTGREVERLIEATKGSRNEARDRCPLSGVVKNQTAVAAGVFIVGVGVTEAIVLRV